MPNNFSGNLTNTLLSTALMTMNYDRENRMTVHKDGAVITTYSYAYDGLKRTEQSGSAITTLVWDGNNYVGEV